LGIGTTSPSAKLSIKGGTATSEQSHITFENTAGAKKFAIGGGADGVTNNNLFFKNVTDNTRPMVITDAGNVGINTDSPDTKMHISDTTGNAIIRLERNDTTISTNDIYGEIQFEGQDASAASAAGVRGKILGVSEGTTGQMAIAFHTASSYSAAQEALRIDSSQNLLVGTTSGGNSSAGFRAYSGGNGAFTIAGTALSLNRLSSNGEILSFQKDTVNVGSIGSYSGGLDITNDSYGVRLAGSSIFPVNSAGGVASATVDLGYSGGQFKDLHLSGTAYTGGLEVDGSISVKDGSTTVGSIGAINDSLYIHSPYGSDAGLRFSSGLVHPCDSSGNPRDNAIDLGYSGGRFKDIYASNGTIQTSDRNEKQDIEDISDAETKVAVVAKGLLKKFRWKSAVEDKGDDARIHFGIIAQDLQDAFTAEGLDAGDYGMFISSTWTDETTGEEQTRLGVRYSELLAFIIAAI
jgi:hypothetical protein